MLVSVHAAQPIGLVHLVRVLYTNHMLNGCLPDWLIDGYLAFSASSSFHRSCFMYISESCSTIASVRGLSADKTFSLAMTSKTFRQSVSASSIRPVAVRTYIYPNMATKIGKSTRLNSS